MAKIRIPTLATALAALTLGVSANGASAAVQAYAWPQSVPQGGTVQLFISTDAQTCNVDIQRQGLAPTSYFSLAGVPGVVQPVPDSSWAKGCNWAPSVTVVVPGSWPSGVYVASVHAGPATGKAIFVVREDNPGSTAQILLQITTSTWQAYNNWGGKCLYDFSSSGNQRAYVVSFQRPYADSQGQGGFPLWELPFIRWLEAEGYSVEYCTSYDLAQGPGLESHYPLLLSVGHDEYWSREMRETVEARTAAGRNVAFFSGNTCWWQVRFDGADRMICYKDMNLDPLANVDNSRVTVNWCANPVWEPENTVTGVSWRFGGYVNAHGYYPASEGYGDYTAYNTDHWVYAGTGLVDGDEFGYAAGIVGYETDGALFQMQDGRPIVTGVDLTPLNFRILGISPAAYGHATMGIFSNPGIIFNAATENWAFGLAADTAVQQITRNLLDSLVVVQSTRVGVGDRPAWGQAVLWSSPSPFSSLTHITFDLPVEGRARLVVFDLQGRRVTTLLDDRLGPGSHMVPWAGRDDLGREVMPGVYLYRLEAGPLVRTGKAVKIR